METYFQTYIFWFALVSYTLFHSKIRGNVLWPITLFWRGVAEVNARVVHDVLVRHQGGGSGTDESRRAWGEVSATITGQVILMLIDSQIPCLIHRFPSQVPVLILVRSTERKTSMMRLNRRLRRKQMGRHNKAGCFFIVNIFTLYF